MNQVWKSPDRNADGQARSRGLSDYNNLPNLIIETKKAIDGLTHGAYSTHVERLRQTVEDCQNNLFGAPRNVDPYLEHYHRYADPVVMRLREIDRLPPRRLLTSAEITRRGSLSVRLTPQFVGPDGELKRAREWKNSLFDGVGNGGREPNEALFIRNAGMLLANRKWDDSTIGFDGLSGRAKHAFRLVAELVNTTYWHCLKSLSRFDLAVDMHVALLRDADRTTLGLEMIDDLAEHRAHLANQVVRLEEMTGYAPAVFLEAIRSAADDTESLPAKLSRELRTPAGVGSDLTPGVVREILDLLNTAIAFRICRLPKAPAAQAEAPAAPAVVHEQIRVPDRPLADPERIRFRERPEIFRAPPYAQLRSAEWPDELSPEFGVNSTMEFVEKLNELRQYEGRLPVPQGSYPSSPRMLSVFVKEARTITRRQNEMRRSM